MFFKKDNTVSKLMDEIEELRKDRVRLKQEVEDLKLKKKIEEEDIKHMVRMKMERLDLEHQKKIQETEREKENEIANVKDKYRDKMELQLSKETANIKEMYAQILERLPNVNLKLKG